MGERKCFELSGVLMGDWKEQAISIQTHAHPSCIKLKKDVQQGCKPDIQVVLWRKQTLGYTLLFLYSHADHQILCYTNISPCESFQHLWEAKVKHKPAEVDIMCGGDSNISVSIYLRMGYQVILPDER